MYLFKNLRLIFTPFGAAAVCVCYGFECLLVALTLTELAELKRLLKTIRYLFGVAADVADCRRMNAVVYFTSLTFFQ